MTKAISSQAKAAKRLGFSEVPVVRLADMTEAEIRAYVIADNKLAENAGWDRNLLALELQYLSDLGLDDLDVTITGFELPEIEVLMGELATTNNDGSADEVAELLPWLLVIRLPGLVHEEPADLHLTMGLFGRLKKVGSV